MARGDLDLTARLSLDAGLFEREAKDAARSAQVFERHLAQLDREADQAARAVDRLAKVAQGDADRALRGSARAAQTAERAMADLEREIARGEAEMKRLGDTADQAKERLGQVGLVAGGMLLAGIGATVKAAADFSKEMSGVAAVSGATAGEMDTLREAALEAGAATAFSASDAARAMTELTRAGVSTKDILGGGLRGSLDLAAAGQLELADAAELSAQAMNIFNLRGSDMSHVADVLAAAANVSAADVTGLGDALRQGGLVAQQTGLSLEETVAALSAFADNALLGSDAGTSLKTMLGSLTPNSKAAKNAMDDVGFSAYDAAGNFIGLEALAGELQSSFSGLTNEQRALTFETIFGSDAVRAASVLYEQGADGVRRYTEAVDDQGAAQRMAAKQLDNLAGDFEALLGSLETASIRSGASLEGLGRVGVQSLTDLLNRYNELPPVLQTGVTYFGLFAGGVTVAASGLLLLAPRIVETRVALQALAATSPVAAAGLGAVGAAASRLAALAGPVAALGAAAYAVVELDEQLNRLTGRGPAEVTAMSDALRELGRSGEVVGAAADELGPDLEGLSGSLRRLSEPSTWQRLDDGFSNLITFGGRLEWIGAAGRDSEQAAQDFRDLDAALAGLVSQGAADEAAQAYTELARRVRESGGSVSDFRAQLPEYDAALAKARDTTAETAATTEEVSPAVAEMAEQFGISEDSAEELDKALESLDKALDAVLNRAFGVEEASDALEAQFDELTEAAKSNGVELDNNTEKGRANRAQLRELVGGVFELVDAQAKNGASSEELQATVDRERERFVKLATQLGFNQVEVNRYSAALDEVPGLVESTFTTPGADEAVRKINGVKGAVEALLRTPGFEQAFVSYSGSSGIQVSRGRPGRVLERAAGGPVWGAGTATSDSIPAYLSNGEYVVKADAVQKYGQGFFDAVNAGRFAQGGLAGATLPLHLRTDALAAALDGALNRFRASFERIGGGVGLSGQPMGVKAMMSIINGEFGPTRLISGFRPGAITATGRASYHGMGRAVDLPPNMALFNFLRGRFPNARELIFSPAGGRQVNNGRPHVYKGVTRAMHFDHIHLAMRNGGLVGSPRRMAGGGAVRGFAAGGGVSPERATWTLVDALHEAERLTDANAREQAALTALREADARWAWSAANAAAAQRDVDKEAAYRELVAAGRLGEVARNMLAQVERERYDNMLRTGTAAGLRGVLATYQERVRLVQEEAREQAILTDLREADARWAWSANNLTNAGRDEDREAALREMQQAGEQGERARQSLRDLAVERTRAADVARIEEAIAAAESRERLAANRAEYEFGRMSVGQQINDLRRRIAAEREFTDEWMRLVGERDRLEAEVQRSREQRREDAARDLGAALDRVQQIRTRMAEAEARMRESVHGIRVALAADTSRMVGDRAAELMRGDLSQRVDVAWGNSVTALRRNVMEHVDQFREWMRALADARSRGVSESVIRAFGLDTGPEALGQLRMFGQATREEIAALNNAVGSREHLAANQAAAEARSGVTRLGEELIAARERANEQLAKLAADFAVEQRAAREELAAVGREQGRSYADAVREGLASGIPAVRDMARELRIAAGGPIRLTAPAQSQTVIVQLDGQTIARSTTTWQQRQNRILRMRAGA